MACLVTIGRYGMSLFLLQVTVLIPQLWMSSLGGTGGCVADIASAVADIGSTVGIVSW